MKRFKTKFVLLDRKKVRWERERRKGKRKKKKRRKPMLDE